MSELDAMLERAGEHLEAAERCMSDGLLNPAYELARTAAELYAKAMILRKTGTYPREHNVAGELRHRKLIPSDVSPVELSRFLDDHTRGGYGFAQPVEAREVRKAVALAARLRKAAEGA